MIRVVVDRSVLMAAAISARGSARDLLLAAVAGHVDVVLPSLVLEETEQNLADKFPRALVAFERFRSVWGAAAVEPDVGLIERVARVVALKDAPIAAAALHVRADYLARYDQKHLLRQRDRIKTALGLDVARPDGILSSLEGLP